MRVVIGLGSNLGDRLGFAAKAIQALTVRRHSVLKNSKVSAVFESAALLLPDSPPEWDIPFLNFALAGDTTLSPRELLVCLKNIERDLGRAQRLRWAPREIDLDILVYGENIVTEEDLKIPHLGLLERAFALWPLSQVWPELLLLNTADKQIEVAKLLESTWPNIAGKRNGTRLAGLNIQRDFLARLGQREVDTSLVLEALINSSQPKLVAIINVTPDSFSDGGKHLDTAAAMSKIDLAWHAGADIIDIGAESTRPGSLKIQIAEEKSRLEPVLKAFRQKYPAGVPGPKLSLDTRNADTASWAVQFSPDWLNDVTGFTDPDMRTVASESNCDVVVMHSLGIPPTKENVLTVGVDPVDQLLVWGRDTLATLEDAGISRQRIIIDPGIGFGKTAQQSWQIIAGANRLHQLGVRVLFGHSRKSFLSEVTEKPFAERDFETAVLSTQLGLAGVDYLRVHEIELNKRATNVSQALRI